MQHRDGMRPRTIDDNKSYQVIKDIEQAKKTASPEELKELEKFETDLNRAIQHFDSKKKIQIPKTLLIENNNLNNKEKNDKNEKSEKKKQNTNNTNSDIPVYELKEYKRPENYIIYASKERDQPKAKDYEAKQPDQIFLSFHGDFMKLEVLESIISSLENNIGKGEKIPDEMAKKIIEENFSKYKSKSDLIIKHFNDRRNELKKSLLRKYWRLQKSTDKYFANTFRRRERDKMKIRKNNQKKEESFEKVKMAGDLCKTNLLSIIDSMIQKEILNKTIAELDNMIFMSEVNQIQKNSIPKEFIEQNEKIIAYLKEKGITVDENNMPIQEEKVKLEDKNGKLENRVGTASTKGDNSKGDSGSKEEESYINESKINVPEIIYPDINFSHFSEAKGKNKIENNKYRVRIRLNRIKKLAVDRYIQKNDSMDPFDDSFTQKIMKYQNYDTNLVMNSINYICFENLFNNYYEQKYKFLSLISDNDDEHQSFFKSKKSNKRLISKKRAYNK